MGGSPDERRTVLANAVALVVTLLALASAGGLVFLDPVVRVYDDFATLRLYVDGNQWAVRSVRWRETPPTLYRSLRSAVRKLLEPQDKREYDACRRIQSGAHFDRLARLDLLIDLPEAKECPSPERQREQRKIERTVASLERTRIPVEVPTEPALLALASGGAQ